MNRVLALSMASLGLSAATLHAQAPASLDTTSLEDLANTKILVSSVSRKEQAIDQAPAAVYVITRNDIERSTAMNIPDLLRVVPGLQVAQISASDWAVSARGFNSAFANKLLVLIDGRSVYSEITSGEHWDEIDMPLNEIERIEIIRGPGAAIWGANAVNGVINIITRSARDTEGTELLASAGTTERRTTLSGGGPVGDRVQYRLSAGALKRLPLRNADGSQAYDGQTSARVSGRLDFQKDMSQSFVITGGFYNSNMRQQLNQNLALLVQNGQESDAARGGYLQGSWAHTSAAATTTVQAHYTDTRRFEVQCPNKTQTLEAELIRSSHPAARVDLVWGVEGRYTWDAVAGKLPLLLKPSYQTKLASGFLQADFKLKPDKFVATLGSKIQDGTLMGRQLQPSARILLNINPNHALWSAISRAVVAPALQDKALNLPLSSGYANGLPVTVRLLGSWNYKPEQVLATELGYRVRFGRSLSLDTAAFFNRGSRIQALSVGQSMVVAAPTPSIAVDATYINGYSSRSGGVEAHVQWRPSAKLKVDGSYTWFEATLRQTATGTVSLIDSPATPHDAYSGTAVYDLPGNWSFVGSLMRVGRVAAYGRAIKMSTQTPPKDVPAYTRLDLQLQRKVLGNVVLQAGGTNLLTPRHAEFIDETTFLVSHSVARSLFIRGSWSF